MKKIIINYEIFGAINIKLYKNKGSIELPKGTTLYDFIVKVCGVKEKYLKYMDISINGKKSNLEKKLKNKSNVRVLLPVGGG